MAMKINELMIGDWVNYSILNLNAKVFSILGNHTIGIQFVDKNNKIEAIHGLLEETIIPIPLTEEILVKNGFEKQEDVNEWSYYKTKDGKGQYMILWSMDYNYLEIGSYTDEFGEFNRLGTMRYVHQLQQALRLCGIEKEIEL